MGLSSSSVATGDVAPANPVGARLRRLRLARGLKQSTIAEMAGISASYLNQIEHGRRRIGGALLIRLARSLDVDASALSEGADRATLARLRAAAVAVGAEPRHTEAFVDHAPGWAQVVLAQQDQIAQQDRRISALADRARHDPALADALHDLISAVTSIRSSASILSDDAPLDPQWQRRFSGNILQEALRLSDHADAISSLLAGPGSEASTPQDLLERHFFSDGGEGHVLAPGPALPPSVQALIAQWRKRFSDDEAALPEARLRAALARTDDPLALAAELAVPVSQVLRRLALSPPGAAHLETGLAICDGAGGVLFRKPLSAMAVPRDGTACPLWPLFEALSRPGHPVGRVVQPQSGPALDCIAIAETLPPTRSGGAVRVEATMLYRAAPEVDRADLPRIGPGCRLCSLAECDARREIPALG